MAAQTIRRRETIAIPAVSGNNIERVGEFIGVVDEVLRLHFGAPFGTYAEWKLPENFSPREKAVIDTFRWGIPPL